jgi:hypothetical protein
MKFLAFAVGLCALVASSTASADQTCKAKAIDEKLAGEALVNFVKQCESDAYMACAEAAHKMLAEPANENAIHTCVAKAVGTGPMLVRSTLLQDQFRLHWRCRVQRLLGRPVWTVTPY